jgi:hypothetical protein
MSEPATDTPPVEAAQPPEASSQEPPDTTDWKAEARKWEQRAKDNKKAADDLDKQRKASMTEAERAVAEAEQRGRLSALTEFGTRLARTEFDAAAARRNPDYDTAGTFEWLDLSRFVGDNGEPDAKAIQAAVERLVPVPTGGTPSFDGGARTTPPAPAGMTALIRKAAGRA